MKVADVIIRNSEEPGVNGLSRIVELALRVGPIVAISCVSLNSPISSMRLRNGSS